MIHKYLWHNDRILPVEQVRLSPGQSGLLCGWGLFTTMRIIDGVAFAFERHWQRLERDAQRTRCPFPFDLEAVRAQLGEVLRLNQVRDGAARIYVIRNQPGMWSSSENFVNADLLICSADAPSYRDEVRLTVRPSGRYAAEPLAGVKVTSWLDNVWNLHEAQQAGFDEVVLLNERGEVAECTAANIFCVHSGRVKTPPLSSGCLPGVTRAVVLEIGAEAGIPVDEQTLLPEDLYAASEVFVSSTNRNVLPVSEIDGHKIPLGSIVERLENALVRYVREYVDARAAISNTR
jgi:branched-chain amino acid aminotransferase